MIVTTDSSPAEVALANTKLAAEQRSLTYGSHWVRFLPQDHFILFGRVLTESEITYGEWKAGNPPNETRVLLRSVRDSLKVGFLFSAIHTIWDPDGLIRMIHRSVVWPISAENFQEAERYRFMPGSIPGRYEWLKEAYNAAQAHDLVCT